MDSREYPIIGMSPGNSYFKDEVVKQLLKTVVEKYGRTAVFVADVPAVFTYLALGYPENRARRDKAIPQGNALKNKTRKAMEELGYSSEQVHIVDWEGEVAANAEYQRKFTEVEKLYYANPNFRNTVNDAAHKALVSYTKVLPTVDIDIETGAKYILSEFAFMEFAPKLFRQEKITYVYHRAWAVYDAYRTGQFDGKVRSYLGASIVTTDIKIPRGYAARNEREV